MTNIKKIYKFIVRNLVRDKKNNYFNLYNQYFQNGIIHFIATGFMRELNFLYFLSFPKHRNTCLKFKYPYRQQILSGFIRSFTFLYKPGERQNRKS